MNLPQTKSNSESNAVHRAYLLACILGITALTYLGTLRFDFVSDDNLQIADNPYIKSWRYVGHFFVTTVWSHLAPNSPHNFYRPMYLFWNLVNYSLFKLNPVGWHATAVLLHVLATALVYFLIRRLVPDRPAVAWLTALIFGVHPIHHEVVAWISGATESLYAIFFLGALLSYSRSRAGRRFAWMALSCALYGLAMFSKETAIVLPAVVFAYEWLAGRADASTQPVNPFLRLANAAGAVLPYVPIAALYLAMRFYTLAGFSHPRVIMPLSDLLLTWPSVLFFYLKHWLLPFHYAGFYDMAYYVGLSFRGVVLPAIVLLGCAAALWFAGRRLGARETGCAVVLMLVPLLPTLDLGIFPLHELAHDRYFYVPSIGAALLVALLLEPLGKSGARLWGEPRKLVLAALLLTAALSFSAATAANQWVDNFTLYTRGYQSAPLNVVVRDGLAAEWIAQGHFDSAQNMLEPVVQEFPDDWAGWLNLARVRYQKADYTAAEADLRRSIRLNPDSAIAYVLLGQTQIKTGQIADAVASVRHGVDLLPEEFRFRIIYGIVLQANGDCPSAITQFNVALKLHPKEGIAERGLALCSATLRNSALAPRTPR